MTLTKNTPEANGTAISVEQDTSAANNTNQSMTVAAPVLGIGLKLASTLVFSIMTVTLKIASETVPVGEIVFARNFIGLWPVLLMVALRGELGVAFKTNHPLGHLGRSGIGIISMMFSFTAYALLPLPDATAIGFASPLFVIILAFFILKEKVRIYRWGAVGVGFLGIIIILSPHMGAGEMDSNAFIGSMCAATSAFLGGLAMIFVRKLCETERTSTIVVWFHGAGTGLALFSIPIGFVWTDWAWVVPDMKSLMLLVIVGISGGIGQILMTQSYRYADASTIAPFDYTSMIWAVLFGYLLFSDVPLPQVLIGAVVVICAGIFVIFREHALGLDRTKARRASTPSKS
ncbi:DMT family transporter [Cohaesibacter marisflavi]|uniref:DMT family transporter n=1 Tax=Cohaesibacter marisflavi TaxID=655353 RepID=UPI0029C9B18C|nr:DMT family transporter [Cohaesibacter marisflavi]